MSWVSATQLYNRVLLDPRASRASMREYTTDMLEILDFLASRNIGRQLNIITSMLVLGLEFVENNRIIWINQSTSDYEIQVTDVLHYELFSYPGVKKAQIPQKLLEIVDSI